MGRVLVPGVEAASGLRKLQSLLTSGPPPKNIDEACVLLIGGDSRRGKRTKQQHAVSMDGMFCFISRNLSLSYIRSRSPIRFSFFFLISASSQHDSTFV